MRRRGLREVRRALLPQRRALQGRRSGQVSRERRQDVGGERSKGRKSFHRHHQSSPEVTGGCRHCPGKFKLNSFNRNKYDFDDTDSSKERYVEWIINGFVQFRVWILHVADLFDNCAGSK